MSKLLRLDDKRTTGDAEATCVSHAEPNAAAKAAIRRAMALHPSNYRGLTLVGGARGTT